MVKNVIFEGKFVNNDRFTNFQQLQELDSPSN